MVSTRNADTRFKALDEADCQLIQATLERMLQRLDAMLAIYPQDFSTTKPVTSTPSPAASATPLPSISLADPLPVQRPDDLPRLAAPSTPAVQQQCFISVLSSLAVPPPPATPLPLPLHRFSTLPSIHQPTPTASLPVSSASHDSHPPPPVTVTIPQPPPLSPFTVEAPASPIGSVDVVVYSPAAIIAAASFPTTAPAPIRNYAIRARGNGKELHSLQKEFFIVLHLHMQSTVSSRTNIQHIVRGFTISGCLKHE